MIEYVIPDFNIDQIARSGQCFRFRREEEGRYSLIAGGKWLDIEQNGETVRFSCTENEFEGFCCLSWAWELPLRMRCILRLREETFRSSRS